MAASKKLPSKFFHIVKARSTAFFALNVLLINLFLPPHKVTSAVPATFQIGWWTGAGVADLSRIDVQGAAGETLQAAYYLADPSTYLAKLQQANIKVFLEVNRDAAASGDTEALTTYVNAYKNHPAIAGWMIYDEPEQSTVPASRLVDDYKAIKAADPNHPVAAVFGMRSCTYIAQRIDRKYFDAADIIMFDTYPVMDQPEFDTTVDGKRSFSDYRYIVNDCLVYAGSLGKPFVIVAQGFQWGSPGPGGGSNRNPTYAEERYFTFMPFIRDVAGLLYWVDYHADASLTATVNQVMSEASAVASVLLHGTYNDPEVSVDSGDIGYKYGVDGAHTYLIAENDSRSSLTVTFTLPVSVQSISVMYDNYDVSTQSYLSRSIPAVSDPSGRSTFTDMFAPYQVHIYELAAPPTMFANSRLS